VVVRREEEERRALERIPEVKEELAAAAGALVAQVVTHT
jgi:hypothetical protein